ncbi:phosphotransferase [Microbacterium resistens]|uniref:phosphotransferase n=1 Tax=Microbacterium resistens TaxID=156977 RepID=UPI0027E35EB4|nr:phosphotransferase [Microbacterium resistens]
MTADPGAGDIPGADRLSAAQRARLSEWIPGARIVADRGWHGSVSAFVYEVEHDGSRLIVKAGDPSNHHIGRELDAHDGWTGVWSRDGIAARLRQASREDRVFVADYLPGELVDGTDAAFDPAVHRRAGELLRRFHDQASRPGDEGVLDRVRRSLASPHRIRPEVQEQVRALLDRLRPRTPELVPTHGDWQPRNWLLDDDDPARGLRVIDFGRFSFRSRASDLLRLAAQQWRDALSCEDAFLDGYGADPRLGGEGAHDHWTALRLAEAVGTAAWAYQTGDEDFEAQGHRMIADVLDEREETR